MLHHINVIIIVLLLYLPPRLLQMVVLCVNTCQIDKKTVKYDFYLVYYYDSLRLYPLMQGILPVLVLAVCCLASSLCVQVWSVPY